MRRIFPCWGKRVIAISQQVKEHLIEDFKLEAEKIVVINNGIDIAKFETRNPKSETRKEFGLNDAPVIGIVARLSDVKGHIYLIDAMKNVLDNFPSAQLLIVGEGKMKDELVKRIEKIGITKNVFFIPEVSETKDALSVMDIFVMPSLKEGLGLSLMEAMASGLPVIGSDVGGIRTLIQSEVNGLLVKPADAESLSGAIIELLSNQKKREFLGNNARMFISQNFSEGKMVDETERLYQECLNIKD